MKKLFISCPVKGRKIEEVIKTRKKMHAIAEIMFDEKLEVIDSVMAREVNDGDTFESLVHHLNCMKDADYFIGVNLCGITDDWNDFWHEQRIAQDYGIDKHMLDSRYVCPDLYSEEADDED